MGNDLSRRSQLESGLVPLEGWGVREDGSQVDLDPTMTQLPGSMTPPVIIEMLPSDGGSHGGTVCL